MKNLLPQGRSSSKEEQAGFFLCDFLEFLAMSTFAISRPPRTASWCCVSPRTVNTLTNKLKSCVFRTISLLTDPICKAHELWRRNYVVEALYPRASENKKKAERALLFTGAAICVPIGIAGYLPAVALRTAAACLCREPFIHAYGAVPEKSLSGSHVFSLLMWNICCLRGHAISDGGVMPWTFRIKAIAEKILKQDADLCCILETFDTASAFYLRDRLHTRYAHFYFNIGVKVIGTSSGIMVLSKFAITNPEFTLFPRNVGRTAFASKGVFDFAIGGEKPFAHIFVTHLQHAEEPSFSTREEINCRAAQMELVCSKMDQVKGICTILTGDLNLDDSEFYASRWHKKFDKGKLLFDDKTEKTWPGDGFCAKMTKKRISMGHNLDHTMVVKGSAKKLETALVKTGYEPAKFKREALSDHLGLMSYITV